MFVLDIPYQSSTHYIPERRKHFGMKLDAMTKILNKRDIFISDMAINVTHGHVSVNEVNSQTFYITFTVYSLVVGCCI